MKTDMHRVTTLTEGALRLSLDFKTKITKSPMEHCPDQNAATWSDKKR